MTESIRVLEVGLRWPPETFIQRKLAGLRRHCVHSTVASAFSADEDRRHRMPGIELIRLASPGEPLLGSVLQSAATPSRSERATKRCCSGSFARRGR